MKKIIKKVWLDILIYIKGIELVELPYYYQIKVIKNNKFARHIKKTGGVILVKEEIPQFNFWVLNKVLGMVALFEAVGQSYRMEITAKEEGFDIIKSFIKLDDQDAKPSYSQQYDLGDTTIINLDSLNYYLPETRELMSSLYQKYIRLTPDFSQYVKEELNLIKGKKVLGVLIRGTDYARKKPKGHPIQPTKEMMLKDIKRILSEEGYKYLYLATDEYENECYLREELKGIAEIIVNQREYFDEFYKSQELPYISSCRHERENDRYLTSKEYFSSIILLSNCDALVAGNCGGSRAAIYMNDGKYKDTLLYDLGNY